MRGDKLTDDVERALRDRPWLIKQIMKFYGVSRDIAEGIATIFVATIGVATIAVLVSRSSKTAEVIEAQSEAMRKILDAAEGKE